MIYLAFYRGEGRFFSDTVVQYITRSQFSHCEMFASDEPPLAGESHQCVTAVGKDGGVRTKQITFEPARWEFVEVPWAPADTMARALGLMGKGYDFWGLLMTQFLNFRRHTPDRWFCSKLCAYAMGLSEAHTYAPGDLKRVVEEHNRIFHLAQLSGVDSKDYRIVGDRIEPLPGSGSAVQDRPGLLANYARNHATILNGEGQWKPHIQQAAQHPVRPRKTLRPSVSPTVVSRGEGARFGSPKPLQFDPPSRTASGEILDFSSASLRQPKLN